MADEIDLTSRYEGKPFLRLLESYVLHAIGQLPPEEAAALRAMEGQLADVYGSDGAWFEIVAARMAFPDTLPDKIRAIWTTGSRRLLAEGQKADPVLFTRHFVDLNFLAGPTVSPPD
jgi:hypothetical protein